MSSITNLVTRLNSKNFITYDGSGSEAGLRINRSWQAGGANNYLTVIDSTADFVELDDCRVEGGQLTSFGTSASITAFDKVIIKALKSWLLLRVMMVKFTCLRLP